jgi:hypothetical protein
MESKTRFNFVLIFDSIRENYNFILKNKFKKGLKSWLKKMITRN